jgi:signal transduction histidine kinase
MGQTQLILFIALAAIIFIVFVLGLLFLLMQFRKRKIIYEKEKEVLTLESLLQGQEIERARMAKDLHDGLGGMLSGIKLNLSSMKGNVIIQEKDVNLFTKSIDQLDNAIAEMRRVAHNMMPEALLKFGLTEAVQDYCDGINESNTVKIKFTNIGLTTPLEKSIEVILYRILQELTNNAIKHASASTIIVQLSKNENILNLTVEDDGKGFDTKQLANIKGTGLLNVQSRVDYLKGNLSIESEKGKGTTVNIDVALS